MPTALVTGVAGFIGSNLANELLDRGYAVYGIDDFSAGRMQNLDSIADHDRFEFHEGDVRDVGTYVPSTTRIDSIFHQAAVASVPGSIDDPLATTETNCTGTAAVLELARKRDIESVVLASSSAVYGSEVDPPIEESVSPGPESPYAASKLYDEHIADQYAEFHGLETVSLRYFNIFGPRQNPNGEYAAVIPAFVEAMLAGQRPTIFGDGEQTRDFVAVEDVVAANLDAARSNATGVFNIGCGRPVTINELVETLNGVLGTDIKPRYDDPRSGDVRHSHADISKAQTELGYEPTIDFEQGIERAIEWYR